MKLRIASNKSLHEAVDTALTRIDEAAGDARRRYITYAPGQAETYLAKYEAAVAYQDNPLNESVWLTAEADATGESVASVAALITQNQALWTAKGAQIEAVRLSGKKGVREASDVAAVFAMMRTTINELQAL